MLPSYQKKKKKKEISFFFFLLLLKTNPPPQISFFGGANSFGIGMMELGKIAVNYYLLLWTEWKCVPRP